MFGRNPKITIPQDLYAKLQIIARLGGYATTDELIMHILSREIAKIDENVEDERDEQIVRQQLRGLGYIE